MEIGARLDKQRSLANRTIPVVTIRPILLRALVIGAAAASAACAETNAQDAAAVAAMEPAASAATPHPTATGRNAVPPPAESIVAEAAPAYTIEKARAECWMKLEADRKAPRDLEKRARLVETCAAEKMKTQAPAKAQ